MTGSDCPKLSVIVTTWNNELFIERCLNSILQQKTEFNFEILIGNDASTDRTEQLINEMARKHPDVIRVFNRPKNLGTSENFIDLVYRANAQYIAQVDGDDYLSDELKFQLQVNLLDEHPECTICFHHYSNHNAKGEILKHSVAPFEEDKITDLSLLLRTTMGPGNTTVFRKSALPIEAPLWLRQCGNHKDFAIQFLVASSGKIAYINRVMSAYTIHENNITKTESLEKLLKNSILINEGFLAYHRELGLKEYEETLKFIINHRKIRLAFFHLVERHYVTFIGQILKATLLHRHWTIKMLKDSLYDASPELFNRLKILKLGKQSVEQ